MKHTYGVHGVHLAKRSGAAYRRTEQSATWHLSSSRFSTQCALIAQVTDEFEFNERVSEKQAQALLELLGTF